MVRELKKNQLKYLNTSAIAAWTPPIKYITRHRQAFSKSTSVVSFFVTLENSRARLVHRSSIFVSMAVSLLIVSILNSESVGALLIGGSPKTS
jgi:hypothetical protein